MTISIIDRGASYAHRSPSEAQVSAGNYKKGHVKFQGLDIAIENARGSMRRGVGADGEPWAVKMPSHYGYIKRSEGADGDHIDVYIGPHHKSPHVFVVDQIDADDGEFDEHKVLLGFGSKKQANNVYCKAFSDGKGKCRIGHVAEMTIDQFKDWLKSEDTTEPIRGNYARGGVVKKIAENTKRYKRHSWDGRTRGPWDRRAHKAEGGPVTDPDVLAQLNGGPKPVTNPDVLEKLNAPDKGILHAAVKGALKGATFNFSDELAGIRSAGPEAVPDFVGPIPARTLVGGARLAANYVTGKDPESVTAYEKARDEERRAQEEAHAQHPYIHTAGQIGGALALPVGAGAQAATLPARMARGALTGAGVGAAYGAGEGETPTQRAIGAGTGAVLGGVTGGLAPPLVEGAIQGISAAARPITNTIRGAINPEGEAGRRVLTGLERDFRQQGPQFTPEEAAVARAADSPTAIIDAGGETTRALARSAANTSPEAREALTGLTQDRFGTQNQRAAEFVQRLTGASGDNPGSIEAVREAAQRMNRPAYARAYREGDREIFSPEMDQLISSPAVVEAMKRASASGKDRAVTEGYGAFNPGVSVENGVVTFRKGKGGVPTYPNLAFWDATKKELDDAAGAAARAGRNGEAGVLGNLARQLRTELDNHVPSYATAREGAARAFGAQDALEAGANFVTARMDNAEARRALARMSAPEQQLFRHGYASALTNKIDEMGDRQTILNKMAQSPADRERLEIALGPQRARQLEAFLRVEGIMDRARTAITGNSTTARQLAELGLAGGAGGIAGHGDLTDPRTVGTAAVVYGLMHGRNRVNERVARRVGEMLASDDPQVLQRGAQMIARHTNLFNNLRAMDGFGSKAGASQAPTRVTPLLQGPVPAGAQNEDQKP